MFWTLVKHVFLNSLIIRHNYISFGHFCPALRNIFSRFRDTRFHSPIFTANGSSERFWLYIHFVSEFCLINNFHIRILALFSHRPQKLVTFGKIFEFNNSQTEMRSVSGREFNDCQRIDRINEKNYENNMQWKYKMQKIIHCFKFLWTPQ
jgi:hypothetical protein